MVASHQDSQGVNGEQWGRLGAEEAGRTSSLDIIFFGTWNS